MKPLTSQNIGSYDVLHPSNVKPMMHHYGFAPGERSDSEEEWVHNVHNDLKIKIPLFSHSEIKKGKLQEIGDICAIAERRDEFADKSDKNSSALPEWLRLRPGYFAEMHGNELTVRNDDFPELPLHFTIKEGDRNPVSAFAIAFDTHKHKLEVYSGMASELKTNYGFEFHRAKDGLTITQPDYEMKYHFPDAVKVNLIDELGKIEKAAEAKCLEGIEKFEGLAAQGFKIHKQAADPESGDIRAELTHEKLKDPVRITLRGSLERVDGEGMKQIDAALAAVNGESVKTSNPNEAGADDNAVRRSMANYVPKAKQQLPEEQKVSLVLDSPVFFDLAAPRGNGRTWLDLLPVAADLPTVDKIYIPAIVADWELRGGITYKDWNGQMSFQHIDNHSSDPNHSRGKHILPVKELLATASRSRLDKGGSRHLIAGKNPNIIIYETEIDRKFMDGVKKIYDDPKIDVKDKWAEYKKLKENINHNSGEFSQKDGDADWMAYKKSKNSMNSHIGEMSMQEIAEKLPSKGPVYMITNDVKFLNDRNENMVTGHGFPIGEALVTGLLGSEISARGAEIKKRLEEHYAVPVGELTVGRIQADIMASGRYEHLDEYPNGHRPIIPGPYMTQRGEILGETLESIFRRGAAIERGEKPEFNMPAPVPVDSKKADEKPKTAGYDKCNGMNFGERLGHRAGIQPIKMTDRVTPQQR